MRRFKKGLLKKVSDYLIVLATNKLAVLDCSCILRMITPLCNQDCNQ